MSGMSDQTLSQTGHRVERMFSSIVPWYDFLNRSLSLGQDIIWRRELVAGLQLPPDPLVLDLAAGTLDVALELVRQFPRARVVAGDFSLPMLQRGREKLASRENRIHPVVADAYALPFPPQTFDALTIAFGVRNLPDHAAALVEMHRVLKPGGSLAILEFVPPTGAGLTKVYELYLTRLLPLIGRLLSRHAFAYRYLAESILHFPPAPAFAQRLSAAGWQNVRWQGLTLGIVGIFYGTRRAV
jgi:demethylmenaquinone methyltransferase/2-methoxy-6-polyprenyl-1,4-benzoquinol methylase